MTTYTNLLTRLNVSNIDPGQVDFPVASFIPGGVLDVTHLQLRYRAVGAYWQPWGPVDAWDPATKVVTWSRPLITVDQIEIRRVTPRYFAFRDPMERRSRVSEKNFHSNADQGLFVAIEWAAQYGIDANADGLLADPGDGPNTLGLIQHTQNHWGPNANYGKTSWDFQFSGGYIDRSHVRAQALLPTGWTELTIDPAENDPGDPSDAPFRFIGDYQLRLDLSTLAGPVTGLVIYRHTPRTVNVSVPLDSTRITAPGMEPSARHAFFVAVEIGEELAKRVPPCECDLFYTSLLYPAADQDDTFQIVGVPVPLEGDLHRVLVDFNYFEDTLAVGVPVPSSGTLISNGPVLYTTNYYEDTLAVGVPVPQSGVLQTIVINTNYFGDTLQVAGVPVPQSGTLVVTIISTNYFEDTLQITAVPTPLSGTLV